MKYPRHFISPFCAFILLFFSAPSSAEDFRVGIAGDVPALFSTDSGGNMAGFNVDMARALCAEMRIKCQLVAGQDIKQELLNKEYDFAVASLLLNDANEANMRLTQRYYKNGAKFIRSVDNKTRISYKGLLGQSVGVQRGAVADDFLTNEFDGVDIRRYDNTAEMYSALQSGEVNFVIGEQFAQAVWVANNEAFELSGPTYNKSKYFSEAVIATRPEETILQERLNNAIKMLRQNGVYREINKQYFPFSIYGR